MSRLILLRHGQSEWNKRNLFTGWVDIPLSKEGIEESFSAGKILSSIPIDFIFTSSLIRSQMTAMLAMTMQDSCRVPVISHKGEGKLDLLGKIYNVATEKEVIPVIIASELNERAYGELQGLNKTETIEKFGAAQVKLWRRSFDVSPPKGESLEMTAARAIPYFKEKIIPFLKEGKNVLICAHGNSLRSIIMDLDKMTKEEIIHFELTTGIPVMYDYKNGKFEKKTNL